MNKLDGVDTINFSRAFLTLIIMGASSELFLLMREQETVLPMQGLGILTPNHK